MAKSLEIPQDIIDNVIAAVGDDKCLLQKCALVSSSFLLPTRKQLFSRITLSSDRNCQGINQFLIQNPIIQSFVRDITLTVDFEIRRPKLTNWINGTSPLAILRLPFCRLECLAIWNPHSSWCRSYDSWDWNNFSSEMRDALSNIIHSSTLKTLFLEGISKVPITLFLHIVHLTTLELTLSPNDFCDENSNSLTRTASKGVPVASIASNTVVDRFVWYVGKEPMHWRGRAKSIFLPFMCRLRFFEIHVKLSSAIAHDFNMLSFLMGSLCISLTSPATLEHLKLHIWFCGPSDRFIINDGFFEDLRGADAWTRLDSIISHPTGSQLQRVDIQIDYSFRYDDDASRLSMDEVSNAVLDGLPLLRTKGILFVKAASEYYMDKYP